MNIWIIWIVLFALAAGYHMLYGENDNTDIN